MEKHYTLQVTAGLLGVTIQTLRNWDSAGKIRTVRTPGNRRRVPESEIVRFLGTKLPDISVLMNKPKRTTAKTVAINDNSVLMCKDIAVFDITRNKVLSETLVPGCLLSATMDFTGWMKTRYSKETNFSAGRIMRQIFGKTDYIKAQEETRALSLSDCYWIKKQNEDVLFKNITPHNSFDPVVNLFTGGKADKCWIDAQTLLKVKSFIEFEPYFLCAALGLENAAQAQVTDEGMILSNFTSTELFYETMEQSCFARAEEPYDDPRDILIERFKEQAVALFVVDYLIENNDRNADDYGFLRSSETGEYIAMAPYHNFDRAWSGDVIDLPESAWQGYRGYIHTLCRRAINASEDFDYGTIIERRATHLLSFF